MYSVRLDFLISALSMNIANRFAEQKITL